MSVLRVGSRGDEVRRLQQELQAAGFSVGGVDGIFGNNTLNAVKSYQRKYGLSADGVVGSATWNKLNTDGFAPGGAHPAPAAPSGGGSGPTLRQGASGAAVSDLQRKLTAAGFSTHGVDGSFGPNTKNAVISFQRAHGLTADGVVGPRTWAALGGSSVSGPTAPSGPAPSGSMQVTGYVNGAPRTITVSPVGNGKYLRSDAAARFNQMKADAARAGINLSVSSGFRTMAQQQYLYDGWIHRRPGFNLAARPGYSNHQGGLSADLGGIGGYGTAAYNWLKNNAGRYGFVNDVGGEYWHWTFRG